jgi:c-di-GMP-binding flagellar brake protein YcgR
VQLVGFRTSQRKAVKLVGCLVLGSTLAKVQMPCTVRDISVKGMCISTGQIKHLSQDADLHASVLLDDRTQTRLKLPCKVRHLRRDTAGVILGVEFLAVEPGQAQAIGSYLTT